MEEGKVAWERLEPLLPGLATLPAEVVVGPARGEDAALVRIGGETWAMASDPVTFATADVGRLAVLVNANDVAVRGARPALFLATVLLAPGPEIEAELRRVMAQIGVACADLGVALVGGHTEVTPGLPRTMIAGTMLGPVRGEPIRTGGLRPGHRVGLTKHAGLEGTAILQAELGERLTRLAPRASTTSRPASWLSVVPEAAIAAKSPAVSAMHDVTEGGVAEGLHELALASGCRIEVDPAAVPLLPETRAACAALSLDPLGLIGSGAMLVGCAERGAEALAAAMAAAGVPLSWIGRAVEPGEAGVGSSLPRRFVRDEIVKLWLLDRLEAVIFDLDGTLVDTPYDWPALRAELGLHGASLIDELDALDQPARRAGWAVIARAEREATAAATLQPGARALLEELAGRGVRTALVTNNTAVNARALIERFDLPFDLVLTRDDGLHKPSGAPLAAAMTRLGATPGRCLAVGDSAYDLAAASDAGCRWIAVVNRPWTEWSRWPGAARVDLDFGSIEALRRFLAVTLP